MPAMHVPRPRNETPHPPLTRCAPEDKDLCLRIERRVAQLGVVLRQASFNETTALELFKQILALTPPPPPQHQHEPRTGLPPGEVLAIRHKISRVISRLDPSRDLDEYVASSPLQATCIECVQYLRSFFSPQTSPVSSLKAPPARGQREPS